MKKLLMILPIALILCFMVGCQDKEAIAELEEMNKEIVKRYWEGKWNERRPEILDELQTQDVVYHGTSMEMNGIEEYKRVYSSFLSAFHDTQVTFEDLIAEGDKVMSRITFSAVH
ncbi:MAG: ester cyclase, partial [bacterium]